MAERYKNGAGQVIALKKAILERDAHIRALEAENAELREGLGRIFRITAAGIAALEGRDHG